MNTLQFKQLTKSACFSDIHFGRKNNSETHNNDCLKFIDWFCEQVSKDKSVDHVVFLGDWFEHRNAINVQTLNKAYEAMGKLNQLGLPIFFIVGNHDLYLRHLRSTHSVIFSEQFENFNVIDEPTIVNDVLFLPFLFPQEYIEFNPAINKAKVIYGHLELQGFVVTGDTTVLDHGPDHTEFKNPKRIFTGHFHKRQIKDNVIYIGNTFPMDFSDTNDFDRGMMMYDYALDSVKFINWGDCPTYIKTSLSALLEDPASILRSNAWVRCLADEDITLEESTKLRERFVTKYKLREFTFEEPSNTELITDTDMDLSGLELESTNTIVIKLLGRLPEDTKLNSNTLIDIYKSL
jgi:DNA repair exonuclease SbcCD nuclease subunit